MTDDCKTSITGSTPVAASIRDLQRLYASQREVAFTHLATDSDKEKEGRHRWSAL